MLGDCECGLFVQFWNEKQRNDSIPLDYWQGEEVEEAECEKPVEQVNACMQNCQTSFDIRYAGDLSDMCYTEEPVRPRCLGSTFCENLHNQGFSYVVGDTKVELYYRMSGCEGSPYTSWQYGFREVNSDPRDFCCQDGGFNPCNAPCLGECVARNLCELGAFSMDQLDIVEPTTNPIPLATIAFVFDSGNPNFCTNWPSDAFGHPCDNFLRTNALDFSRDIDLDDIRPETAGLTYGQYFCKALYSRWGVDYPVEGIDKSELRFFGRMPGCPENDDYLRWETRRTYSLHPQHLCCDVNGDWKWCDL